MDSGDIIYILIGAAWLIYAFLRKSKARSKQSGATNDRESSPSVQPVINDRVGEDQGFSPETEEEVEEKSFFEKIFTADMPGDRYSTESRKDREASEFEELVEMEKQHQKEIEHLKKEAKAATPPPPSPKEYVLMDEISDLPDEASDFDLRNAVIYYEILKRPQY